MALADNHGGTVVATARRLGLRLEDLIDMSSNLSPFGMAPGLADYLARELGQLGHLPEIDNRGVERAFADHAGCAAEQVLAGPGTTEFIFNLPRLLSCERAVLVQPTYNDYALACQQSSLPVMNFFLDAEDDFHLDLAGLSRRLRPGDLLFLCNPNNPSGYLLDSEELHAFAAAHARVTIVVDESYLPFLHQPSLAAKTCLANLLVLCSVSKIYGIPGLRLGFLVAHPRSLAPFSRQMRPWAVNRLAQLAGEYLFASADGYVAQVRDYLTTERPRVERELATISAIRVIPAQTNFLLCQLSCGLTAEELAARLLESRIMIRNCANFTGLDNAFFRISLQSRQQNDFFLARLREQMTDRG